MYTTIKRYFINWINYFYNFFRWKNKKKSDYKKLRIIKVSNNETSKLRVYIIIYNDMDLEGTQYNLDFEIHDIGISSYHETIRLFPKSNL